MKKFLTWAALIAIPLAVAYAYTDTWVGTLSDGYHLGTKVDNRIGAFGATPVSQQANTQTPRQVLQTFGFMASGGTDPYLNSPTFVTPNLGVATATSVNGQSFPTAGFSTTAQTPAATTRTYIAGSKIVVPAGKIQIGTIYHCRFNMTKTAAGSAASTFDVAIGTAGTTADTAVISFTKPAGTAAADEGFVDIDVVFRGPLSASCIASGEFVMTHNLSATGHAQIPVVVVNTVSGAFDATVANLIIGVCITSGASDAITIQQCNARATNL